MNTKITLFIICAILLSSCSLVNKTTQTVDDVYYSPTDPGFGPDLQQQTSTYEDDEILMSIQDPRWRALDYDYAYTPYSYGYTSDYYYNPYYCAYPVYNNIPMPQSTINTTPRMTNLNAYNNTNYNNSNKAMKYDKINTAKQQKTYSSFNQSTGSGSLFHQIFSGSNNNNAPTYNNTNSNNNNTNNTNNNTLNDRNYSPSSSSSSSSSSGGSGGGGGGVSRPSRN